MSFLLLSLVSLILAVAITPVIRVVARRLNLVDLPNHRKVHCKPIPRLGGVAIFAAYFGSFVLASLFPGWFGALPGLGAVKVFAPAALFVFLTGFVDDLVGLKASHKFAAELIAGLFVVSSGTTLQGLPWAGAHPVFSGVCTILWLVACTNAVNLIDGLDGLAAGIALLATGATLIASFVHGTGELAVAAVPLAGALAGFLVFNFNPASIFLGDSGSLFIGFQLGCFSLLWSEQHATVAELAAPIMTLAVPLLDTTLAVVRRFLRSRPIFSPDRSHIHHRLLARGLKHRNAVLLLYAASACAAMLAVLVTVTGKRWEPLVMTAFAGCVMFGVQQLGYEELTAARRILTLKAFGREVNAQLTLRGFENQLAAAETPGQCWTVIRNAAQEFGFHPVRLRFGEQLYVYQPESSPSSSWALRMPISREDWIELFHEIGPIEHAGSVLSFAETVRRVLGRKQSGAAPISNSTHPAAAGTYRATA